MIIQADKEGKALLAQISNLAIQGIVKISNSVRPIPEPEKEQADDGPSKTPSE